MKFEYIPAEDDSMDSEYKVLTDDGHATNLSIQVCFDGAYQLCRYTGEGANLTVEFLNECRSLAAAKRAVMKVCGNA